MTVMMRSWKVTVWPPTSVRYFAVNVVGPGLRPVRSDTRLMPVCSCNSKPVGGAPLNSYRSDDDAAYRLIALAVFAPLIVYPIRPPAVLIELPTVVTPVLVADTMTRTRPDGPTLMDTSGPAEA